MSMKIKGGKIAALQDLAGQVRESVRKTVCMP